MSDAPLLWRMRHKLGNIAFLVALIFVALGALALGLGAWQGDVASISTGIGLMIGGALIMVGRRMGQRRPRR